jgi:hypothetical protein
MLWLSLILAAVAGAAAAFAVMQASSAAHWRARARTAEGLLDRAAARRSNATARGNVTRKAEERERVRAKCDEMRGGR